VQLRFGGGRGDAAHKYSAQSRSISIIKEKLHVNEGNNGRSATAPNRLKDFLAQTKKTEIVHNEPNTVC
jgi:hypothetical protein